MQPVKHPVGRLKMSLNAEELLCKGPRDIGGNLRATRPSLLATSLNGLVGSDGMAEEEVCTSKTTNQKSEARVRLA